MEARSSNVVINMITWLAIQTFFRKFWSWCKKYWQILVGAAIPVVIWLLTRDSSSMNKVLESARENHKKEIDTINESHKNEIEQREKAQDRYFKLIKEIEAKYKNNKKVLDEKKQIEIKNLLDQHGEDPDTLAEKLSELTGFSLDP